VMAVYTYITANQRRVTPYNLPTPATTNRTPRRYPIPPPRTAVAMSSAIPIPTNVIAKRTIPAR
jgi:hypothetical protein